MPRFNDTFAAIPACINSRMSELDQHEYWGDDFAEGKSEFLLIQKSNGRYILCITYGSWDGFSDMKLGSPIALQHTQNGSIVEGMAVAIVNKDNVDRRVAKYGDKKIPTWTLK